MFPSLSPRSNFRLSHKFSFLLALAEAEFSPPPRVFSCLASIFIPEAIASIKIMISTYSMKYDFQSRCYYSIFQCFYDSRRFLSIERRPPEFTRKCVNNFIPRRWIPKRRRVRLGINKKTTLAWVWGNSLKAEILFHHEKLHRLAVQQIKTRVSGRRKNIKLKKCERINYWSQFFSSINKKCVSCRGVITNMLAFFVRMRT